MPAAARGQVDVGVQGSWSEDREEGLGLRLSHNPGSPAGLELVGTAGAYAPVIGVDRLPEYHLRGEVGAAVVFSTPFTDGNPVLPFVRSGVSVTHSYLDPPDSPYAGGPTRDAYRDTELAVPVHLGVRLPVLPLDPYAELGVRPFEVYWWEMEPTFTVGLTVN